MDTPLWWHDDAAGGVRVAFTSVRAGNLGTHVGDPARALENRRSLEEHLGLEVGSVHYLQQIHSSRVLDASSAQLPGPEQPAPEADAWISPRGVQPLAVMGADCPPILLAGATSSGVVTGAAHTGRPGLLGGVLENTVSAMRSRARELSEPGAITAWIGPGACGQCYEIPEEMVDQIAAERPAIRSRTRWGTAALDLKAEAAQVLSEAGIEVVDTAGCTMEDESLFSHRRSSQQGAAPGRIAGIIWTP
ncbi:polyphenol oxidase family protein [Nesterenkonia cremea]|uniref:Laccase domain protein n=1 Tax=Nesterenkonia cremea TaxID=1882340 RepID=A0A917AMS6_9MICC|nr:polyphenol oxidase family protein [Nesterenkonia cremea]GGE61754.1 laccase domain protein [Nesterenkonia cremea]